MQNVSYFSKINTLFKCNQSEIQIVLNTFCLNKHQKNDIIEKNKEKGGAICMGDYNFRFSVIIPVYKVEEYLTETLQSLENQTIGFEENIQVVLVNDGSPDNSDKICKEFRDRYPNNVVYIEKENGGVSSARNEGIAHIKGKYVNFLDSDDKWEENAFLNAYNFFEAHYDEIDVLSCRVKKFGASESWHILDFKFQNGDMIYDLTDKKDCTMVQSHVATSIIKAEAITENNRFAEGVRFGEDSMFINGIILRKLKFGVLQSGVYFYRKRMDNSSATQVQNESEDYYTTAPEKYYSTLVDLSRSLYGEVVPYIQNVLVYDIGWRVHETPSEKILNNENIYKAYCELLKKYLSLVDEKYIVSNKVHKRIGYKVALLRLRDGSDLLSETTFDTEKEAIFYKDMSLLRLQSKHKLCYINVCRVRNDKENGKTELIIEGLIAKWVLDCCKNENVSFTVRVGKKNLEIKRRDYSLVKAKSFYGESNRYDSFRKKIDIGSILSERERVRIEFCLNFSGVPYPITVNYSDFVPYAKTFSACHNVYAPYIVTNKNTHITVRKSQDIAEDKKLLKEKAEEKLVLLSKEEFIEKRNEIEAFKESFGDRKLWVMGDREMSAGDNAEAFFRFVCEKAKNESFPIIPVFALSEKSEDFDRLSSYGKVVSTEGDEFRKYLMCSDKIIMSGAEDFMIDYLSEDEKIYLGDLIKNDTVIIDRELIAKDKSETHGKFSTNAVLYCVAREKQVKSVLKADGCYFKEEVVLTGAPRFDLYENTREKLIVIRPYEVKDETAESFRESESFLFWNRLINDKKLHLSMMLSGYKGVICLPTGYKEYADAFSENRFFKVTDESYEALCSKASVLVTDFNPGFEFAYNEKPVIYAHFMSTDDFYSLNPDRKGMFGFGGSGFGKICSSKEETAEEIIRCIKDKAVMSEKYKNRTDEFFSFKDRNNCQRVFDEIMKL